MKEPVGVRKVCWLLPAVLEKLSFITPGGPPIFYLGYARDDIRIFAGVVFLVPTENSNLAGFQNVNLEARKKKIKKCSLL